jgi:hypothetical protein
MCELLGAQNPPVVRLSLASPARMSKPISRFAHTEGKTVLCYSPDGRCVTPLPSRARTPPEFAAAAPPHAPLPTRARRARPSRRTPRRRHLITGGADNFVRVFEVDSLSSEPRQIEHNTDAVTAVAISAQVRARSARAANRRPPPLTSPPPPPPPRTRPAAVLSRAGRPDRDGLRRHDRSALRVPLVRV